MSDQNSDPSRPFDPPVPPTTPPTPPQAPPAPPVAPEPQRPEVPKYGEYAPVDATNPYGVPGYAPSTNTAPVAPGMPAYAAPAAPAYAPPVRKRRTWDVVLTCILLVLGLFGMSLGLLYAWAFTDPEILKSALAQQGLTGNLTPGAAPAVIAISHIVLYLLALGLSIPLLIRGKGVVFWIPLVIGVIAAIIFWVSLGIVISSDSTLLNSYVNGS